MERKSIRFKGWDWTELLEIWPETKKMKWLKDMDANPYAIEEAQAEWLNGKIRSCCLTPGEKPPKKRSWEYRQMRKFFKTCAKKSPHTGQQIMLAIANEPDDYAFLGWLGDVRRWWT